MKKNSIILSIFLLFFFINSNSVNSKSIDNSFVKVYFFHGKYRCSIEQNIEILTKNTVENEFAKQLQKGKIKLSIIDYDSKKNNHFINDYKLINQAVILAKYKNGKQIEWINCKKVWDYADNEFIFRKYLVKEIKKILK